MKTFQNPSFYRIISDNLQHPRFVIAEVLVSEHPVCADVRSFINVFWYNNLLNLIYLRIYLRKQSLKGKWLF